MPSRRCVKTFGRQTNTSRRFSSGSHHLVFTVLHDLQWLPPTDESKKLQPKVANPVPKTTNNVKTKELHFVGEVFLFFPLCIDEGSSRRLTPADRAQPIPSVFRSVSRTAHLRGRTRLWDNAVHGAHAPNVPGRGSPGTGAYSRPINRHPLFFL